MSPVLIESGVDQGEVWHYGDPLREQRHLANGSGGVGLTRREVVRITGDDRLDLIRHLFSSAATPPPAAGWADGVPPIPGDVFFTDGSGQVTGFLALVETGEDMWGWTEPGQTAHLVARLSATALAHQLDIQCEPRPDVAVAWLGAGIQTAFGTGGGGSPAAGPLPFSRRAGIIASRPSLGGVEAFLARSAVPSYLAVLQPVGLWAYEACRIAAGIPRFGLDTDHKTTLAELGVEPSQRPWGEGAAASAAGAQPRRRLARLFLDGSEERLLAPGRPVRGPDGRLAGRLGSMSYHYELGAIGLALVDRGLGPADTVTVDGVPAAVEPLA